MKVNFNLTGSERKALVRAIASKTGETPKYLSLPTLNYEIGPITVDKFGSMTWTDEISTSEIEHLVEQLSEMGFETDAVIPANSPPVSNDTHLSVSIPDAGLDAKARANLDAILKAKGSLIKKALNTNDLPVLFGQGETSFPWFDENASPEESHAYMQLISKLCEYARNQKRVTATEKEIDNEKYAFRCFLLRLGFIGDEYKTDRKVLLKNFTGSSAFKSDTKNDAAIPTPENTVNFDVEEARHLMQYPEVREEIRSILNGEEAE